MQFDSQQSRDSSTRKMLEAKRLVCGAKARIWHGVFIFRKACSNSDGESWTDRHRGSSRLLSPATPPDKRVRIRRFEELRSTETGDAELIGPA